MVQVMKTEPVSASIPSSSRKGPNCPMSPNPTVVQAAGEK